MKKAREPIPEGRRIAGRVFLGLCLAVAGTLLLLNNLGSLPYNVDWRFWPLFLAALAGARMVERGVLRTGPHVLVLIALFLLADSFDRRYLLERWWPLSVVWFGVLMTLRAFFSRPKTAPPACEDEPERQS
jgi:hypothetical protein